MPSGQSWASEGGAWDELPVPLRVLRVRPLPTAVALAPTPRAVGEALTWSACGLLMYAKGSNLLHQRTLPSRSALTAGGEAATADPEERVEWLLPGNLTASALSSDALASPSCKIVVGSEESLSFGADVLLALL